MMENGYKKFKSQMLLPEMYKNHKRITIPYNYLGHNYVVK